MISIVVTVILIASISLVSLVPMNVNATRFGRCTETSTHSCEERDRHPESYCIAIEEDTFCDDIDICDNEGDVTSEDPFCTGDAVRR
jgi:hypothetical protein